MKSLVSKLFLLLLALPAFAQNQQFTLNHHMALFGNMTNYGQHTFTNRGVFSIYTHPDLGFVTYDVRNDLYMAFTNGLLTVNGITTADGSRGFTNDTVGFWGYGAGLYGDDEAYGSSWNGKTGFPTKNAVYDKIQTISGGGGSGIQTNGGTGQDNLFTNATFRIPAYVDMLSGGNAIEWQTAPPNAPVTLGSVNTERWRFTTNVVFDRPPVGDGSSLTNLNAGNLASGTVADARLSGIYNAAQINNTNIIFSYLINTEEHFLAAQSAGSLSTFTGSGTAGGTGCQTVFAANNLDTLRSGVAQLETGTTASGYATIGLYGYIGDFISASLGAGRSADITFVWRVEDLSTDAENYLLRLGMADSATGSEPVDCVMIRYSNTTNSGNIQFVTRANSTESLTNTVTAVAADTWYTNRITVNADATLATLYHNGSVIASLSANIPDVDSSLNRTLSLGLFTISKKVGTTERVLYLDYFKGQH